MADIDLEAIKALTPGQRAAIDASVAGGLVAYIHRLLDGHRPAFSRGRDNELVFCGCRCDDVLCSRWAFAMHLNDVLTAYEAKIEDFAAETRRSDALVAAVEQLRNVLGSCVGFIVCIRDDHTTDEWTEDAARRLCREIYAALHPQEPSE